MGGKRGKVGIYEEAYSSYVTTQLNYMGHKGSKAEARNIINYANLFKRFLPRDVKNHRTLVESCCLNSRILDIGCGMGEFMLALQRLGYSSLEGIDLSQECINYCHEIGLSGASQGSVKSVLRGKSEEYDVITMIDVIEHIPSAQLLETVQLVRKALKPNGRLILRTPNMDAPFAAGRTRYCDLTHVTGFTTTSLGQLLRIAGFSRINFYNQEDTTLRNTLKRMLIKLPVRLMLKAVYYAMCLSYPEIDTDNIISVAFKPHRNYTNQFL